MKKILCKPTTEKELYLYTAKIIFSIKDKNSSKRKIFFKLKIVFLIRKYFPEVRKIVLLRIVSLNKKKS